MLKRRVVVRAAIREYTEYHLEAVLVALILLSQVGVSVRLVDGMDIRDALRPERSGVNTGSGSGFPVSNHSYFHPKEFEITSSLIPKENILKVYKS
jgi:hypothetical protein